MTSYKQKGKFHTIHSCSHTTHSQARPWCDRIVGEDTERLENFILGVEILVEGRHERDELVEADVTRPYTTKEVRPGSSCMAQGQKTRSNRQRKGRRDHPSRRV